MRFKMTKKDFGNAIVHSTYPEFALVEKTKKSIDILVEKYKAKDLNEKEVFKILNLPWYLKVLVKKANESKNEILFSTEWPDQQLSEAYYHLMGGKEVGLKPCYIKHEGMSHWYLKDKDNNIIDLTVEQFKNIPDYSKGIGKGFLTKKPSKRAQELISRVEGIGKCLYCGKNTNTNDDVCKECYRDPETNNCEKCGRHLSYIRYPYICGFCIAEEREKRGI